MLVYDYNSYHLLRVSPLPETMPNMFHVFFLFTLKTVLSGLYNSPHFTDEMPETQRNESNTAKASVSLHGQGMHP